MEPHMNETLSGLELRSTVTGDGQLRLELIEATIDPPGPDEIVVKVEATPLNPSDLALLFGPADMETLEAGGTAERPTLTAAIPAWAMGGMKPRLDQPMAVGNEGAGTVVRAGSDVADLLGKRVGMVGGAMYAQYRKIKARDVIVLPEDASAAHGASMFVNPLTALGFVETMRAEGHTAIVHLAAASNLGQMLNRLCLKDGIPLVNIVRSEAQAALLRDQGAKHVLDSTAPDYESALAAAIEETGATIAFDPISGGRQAAQILSAMERSAAKTLTAHSRYGSSVFKQVYIYGVLDPSPTVLDRWVGFSWSVGGWLLFTFLQKAGLETVARLRQRVVDELKTTFASQYTKTISLADALKPEYVRACHRKATGEKYLIDPSL
jgi:NADPH:quinone reductase-like Zn-dependent oxidoreductase